MKVAQDWPTYLLKNIPSELRDNIESDAVVEQAMSEVIRKILCAHYSLECEPVRTRGKNITVDGTETMLLRLQPQLWKEIKKDAKKRNVSHRMVIIEALEAHY